MQRERNYAEANHKTAKCLIKCDRGFKCDAAARPNAPRFSADSTLCKVQSMTTVMNFRVMKSQSDLFALIWLVG
jgi:hypothetical protein